MIYATQFVYNLLEVCTEWFCILYKEICNNLYCDTKNDTTMDRRNGSIEFNAYFKYLCYLLFMR